MIFVAPRVTHILHDFLHDTSRSGKYAMTAETYANASISCMKYLYRARLGPPINLHHTPRNLARRKNSPWHWRRYKKLIRRLPTVYGKQSHTTSLPSRQRKVDVTGWKKALSKCKNLKEQFDRHQKYTNATRLGLDFLRHALPLSAPSDKLVGLLRADRSFSQRAMQFPIKLKKCKTAIAIYLARVGVYMQAV